MELRPLFLSEVEVGRGSVGGTETLSLGEDGGGAAAERTVGFERKEPFVKEELEAEADG